MNRRAVILSALLMAAVAALAAVILSARSGRRVSGSLRHEVYVWQRAWSQPVRDAVARHATNFSALARAQGGNFLEGQEAAGRARGAGLRNAEECSTSIGMALRIGPYAGPFARTTTYPLV